MKKGIAILGSTGSIGTQALEVISQNKDLFSVEVLTANNNVKLLAEQARLFEPNIVVIANKDKYSELVSLIDDLPIKVYAGNDAVAQVVETDTVNMVLTALVGYSGLIPTINAIKAKKHIALANKETLVVAGQMVTKLAKENGVAIVPVDSEHSAIFQCLAGERASSVEKLILTASGGAFRGMKADQLQNVTVADALKHPNWDMGAKVTIDSASLMNKGLEVIEARWLFDVMPEDIDIVVHHQSIIHSAVQFTDGSIKAQIGLPDMKLPIQYAMSFPERIYSPFKRFDFADFANLTFEKPDIEVFRNLDLAFQAIRKDGNMPCVLNAANEVVVDAFINNKVSFLNMPNIIEDVMSRVTYIEKPTLNDLIETDKESRLLTTRIIHK